MIYYILKLDSKTVKLSKIDIKMNIYKRPFSVKNSVTNNQKVGFNQFKESN